MAVDTFPRKRISRPHTSVTVDTSQLSGVAGASEKTLMLIGQADGGEPNTVYSIRNINQAKRVFRSGELLDAIELAWTGSPDATAGDILAMRIEDATQATLEKGGLKIKSNIHGSAANDIQVALEDNNITNSKRLRIVFAKDGINKTYDNLGNIFQIQYKGSESNASFSILKDSETGLAKKLVLVTGGTLDITEIGSEHVTLESDEGTIVKEYDLEKTYTDVNSIVKDINNLPDFEAKFSPFGDKNIETKYLDKAQNVDILNRFSYVTGLYGDIIKQLEYDELVSFETISGQDIETFELTSLEGASNGEPVVSWAEKFQHFANEGGYYLVPLTDKESVHAEAGQFVRERSDVGEPMRAIVGGGSKENKEKLFSRVATLQSNPRVSLIGSSGTFSMEDGRALKTPGYMVASAVAGLACGLDIGESITFKNLYLLNLDTILDGSELDQLNENGIISIQFVRNRTETSFRIVEDVTTFNDKTDPVKQEMAVGEANDFLVSELKVSLDNKFIGTRTFNTSASLIKDHLISYLNRKVKDNEIQGFTAEDIQVIVEGNQAHIAMTVFPMRTFKKITVSLVYKQQTLQA